MRDHQQIVRIPGKSNAFLHTAHLMHDYTAEFTAMQQDNPSIAIPKFPDTAPHVEPPTHALPKSPAGVVVKSDKPAVSSSICSEAAGTEPRILLLNLLIDLMSLSLGGVDKLFHQRD